MEKQWLKWYDKRVPHTLQPYPEQTLPDVLRETAHFQPEHLALWFKGARLSYGELDWLSDVFASALAAQGVKKGDRVAVMMPNCPQFVITELGAWKAGAVVVPISPLFAEPEVQRNLADCGAKIVVVLTPFYERIKAVQARTQVRCVIATNIKEYLPPALRIAFTLLKENKEGHRITLRDNDLSLSELLHQHAQSCRPLVRIRPEDPALFIYTGGTTGTPKAAIGTHHGLLMMGLQLNSWGGLDSNQLDGASLGNMPLFHISGTACLASALVHRSALALVVDPRDLDDVVDTIQKVRPPLFVGTPTLFIELMKHPKVIAGKVDFKSVKTCLCGAAPLLLETKNRFEALTGGRIVEIYSLTEAMMASVCTPVHGMYKPGSVGVPLPDVEVRITDADSGFGILPPGQVGEIIIRAPQVIRSYWERPDETANLLREGPFPGSGERWLYTGDLGYMDSDGYLFIADRKKDLIKPAGKQVWPREVEEAIALHPAVAEVGVAGIPDEHLGEAVKAWVVLRTGQQVTAAELQELCAQQLAGYKVPQQIEFRDSLPKTMIGKIQRRELVRQESARRAQNLRPTGTESRPRIEVVAPALAPMAA